MKKAIFLMVCIFGAVMFAVTGFAEDAPDAYSIYQRASKNLDSATSIEMAGTSRTKMEMEGIELGAVVQQFAATTLKLPDGAMQMKMHSTVKQSGEDAPTIADIDVYYRDGYLYTKMGSETTKIKLGIEDALAQANSLETGLSRDAFKDAVAEQTDEGVRISFKCDVNDMVNSGGSFMNDLMSGIAPDSDIKFGEVSYSMLVGSDNMIKSYDMEYDMDMTVEGVTIKTRTKASYLILSTDRVKSITFPDGLNAYALI